jgi:hypothetical protein
LTDIYPTAMTAAEWDGWDAADIAWPADRVDAVGIALA